MATPQRKTVVALNIRLIGGRFYQNVRRLLRRYSPGGKSTDTPDVVVQFTSVLTLDAPEQEVATLHPPEEGSEHYRMAVHHFGLLGTHGALPLCYTEWLIDRRYRYGDESAQAFLDIFTHRLLSLRFQAWQKYRLYIRAEREPHAVLPAVISAQAGQCVGNGVLPVAANCVGLLATPARTLVNLQHLLRREFSLPVEVIPFQACWRTIEPAHRGRLGESALGMAPMLGEVYRDVQTRFLIRLGPLAIHQRSGFMPGNASHRRFMSLVRQFSGPLLSFSLELVVRHEGVGMVLNGQCRLGGGGELGVVEGGSLQRVFLSECHE